MNFIAKSSGDLILSKDIVQFLNSKINNSLTFGGKDSSLPKSWNSMGLIQIN